VRCEGQRNLRRRSRVGIGEGYEPLQNRAAFAFCDAIADLQAVAAYVDHTQPTRATASRSHQEARFERATEPAALKDRALALLAEGGRLS
jgi:hypothetical protein